MIVNIEKDGDNKTTFINDKKPTLKELQLMVGGLIEVIFIEKDGKEIHIIIDEEGKLKGKSYNAEATLLWGVDYDIIVGDAVILSGKALLD